MAPMRLFLLPFALLLLSSAVHLVTGANNDMNSSSTESPVKSLNETSTNSTGAGSNSTTNNSTSSNTTTEGNQIFEQATATNADNSGSSNDTIIDVAVANNLTTLLAAAEAAGLMSALSSSSLGSLTILGPTNDGT